MARIPLAEIPNAPQTAPMPLGDNLQGVNLMGAARMMQRNQIAQGSFDGPAEGMQALGRGLAVAGAGVGNALTRIAEAKMQADDDTHVMGATAVLNQTWADYQSSLAPGSDTNSWVPGWDDTLNKTAKQLLANKSLSPTAKALVNAELVRFRGQTMPRLTMSAAKESFDRSTKAHAATAEAQIETGDVESAKKTYDVMLSKGLLYPEQAEGLKQAAERQGEFNRAVAFVSSDPIEAANELSDTSKFPTLSTSQRRQLQEQAEREKVGREKAAFEFIGESIKTGRIDSLDDAQKIGGEYLTDATLMKIEQMLKREAPVSYEAVSTLQDRADALDPLRDKTGRERFELERDAYELPEPFRGQIMKAVSDKYDGKPGSVTMTEARQKLDAALNNQLLGKFDQKEVRKGNVEETRKKEAAYQLKLKIEKEVEDWSKANPNASDSQRNEFLNERFRANGLMQEPDKSRWYLPWTWFQKSPAASPAKPAPLDTTRQIDEALKKYRPQKTSSLNPDLLPAGLRPHAADFADAAEQYGLDPHLLAAISAFETAGGTSKAFREKNNAMGISNAKGPIALASVRDSIFRQARTLANPKGPYKGAASIEEIAAIYAPPGAGNDPHGTNAQWAGGVKSWLSRIKKNA